MIEDSKTKPTGKIRVNFDFSPENFRQLEELCEKIDVPTKAEGVRRALKFYNWYLNQVKPNYTLTVTDESEKVVMRFGADFFL